MQTAEAYSPYDRLLDLPEGLVARPRGQVLVRASHWGRLRT
jgi:hypothetical protein